MELEVPQDHGWNDDFSLEWPQDMFREDVIKEIVTDSNEESDYDTDSE